MTATPGLLPGTTARTPAEWAAFDAALTARAAAGISHRWTPSALAAEERDQHRIDDAQDERDHAPDGRSTW